MKKNRQRARKKIKGKGSNIKMQFETCILIFDPLPCILIFDPLPYLDPLSPKSPKVFPEGTTFFEGGFW